MSIPLDAGLIRRFAPRARDEYVAALIEGGPALIAAQLDQPLRFAHFMAQAAHETGGFTIVREATNWTPEQVCRLWPGRFKTVADPRILLCRGDARKLANMAYAAREELGNQGGDDGWAFRGGSFLQATGRAHYRELAETLGVDLENRPELIEDARIGLLAALHVWTKHNLNRLADRNYGRAIGNAINRGYAFSKHEPIGYLSRQQWFARSWAAFGGGGPAPEFDGVYLGAYSPQVQQLQHKLATLGYGVGGQDGVYGPTLLRAVAAFKQDQKTYLGAELEPDDQVAGLTMAAIDVALVEGRGAVISPERQNATEVPGSEQMAAGQQMVAAGTATASLGIGGALHATGVLDGVAAGLGKVTAIHTAAVPFMRAVSWGLANFWWTILLVAGIWAWRSGKAVQLARLAAHRLGINLNR